MRLRTLLALAATATGVAVTPAGAAAATCTPIVATATTATPNVLGIPHDIVDVATANATCVDLGGFSHTATFVFEWFYVGGAMPACPTTQSSTTVPGSGAAIHVTGNATCQRPASSPASVSPRDVLVQLFVDGLLYSEAWVHVTGS